LTVKLVSSHLEKAECLATTLQGRVWCMRTLLRHNFLAFKGFVFGGLERFIIEEGV